MTADETTNKSDPEAQEMPGAGLQKPHWSEYMNGQRLAEYGPAEVPGVCPRCGDLGFILKAGDNQAYRCDCKNPARNEKALARAMATVGMGDGEIRSAQQPWDASVQPEPKSVVAWCIAAAEAQHPKRRRENPLLGADVPWVFGIFGKNGRGKTKVAAMGMMEYLRAWSGHSMQPSKSAKWVNTRDAITQILAERYQRRPGELTHLEYDLLDIPFLVLDEAGAERDGAQTDIFEGLLLGRYRKHRWTLFTTNAESVEEMGDGRVSSRMAEGERILLASSVDYRKHRAASQSGS